MRGRMPKRIGAGGSSVKITVLGYTSTKWKLTFANGTSAPCNADATYSVKTGEAITINASGSSRNTYTVTVNGSTVASAAKEVSYTYIVTRSATIDVKTVTTTAAITEG